MSAWLPGMAGVASLISAVLIYAASPHGRWSAGRWRPRLLATGVASAVPALGGWIAALGVGAGCCAMLAGWMLALLVQPGAGLLVGHAPTATAARDHA
ncbi:hypothetical protein [Dyella sp. A6]|uniref:hypothetical protein n=1 Tax=Dyella aluminiiresistens TaxID=3069105 RepID=UPI002E75D261|nr:hypothetical protein [Dyella sp. A6]